MNLKYFFLFVLCVCFSCDAHRNISEKLSFIRMGYGQSNIFIYEVTQSDSNNVLFQKDTLALLCSGIIMKDMDGQTRMQWISVTNDISSKLVVKSTDGITGIKSNDSVLFIHPPRFDCFRILEFCPHPLFYLKTDSGTWNWDMRIGAVYASPDYPVSDVDTFKIKYSFVDTLTMKVAQGVLFCHHFTAISKSKYGISRASYYLNNQYGMIKFTFQPVNKKTFDFRLMYATDHPDSDRFSNDLIYFYNSTNKRADDFNYFK